MWQSPEVILVAKKWSPLTNSGPDQIWQPKLVQGPIFGNQNWSAIPDWVVTNGLLAIAQQFTTSDRSWLIVNLLAEVFSFSFLVLLLIWIDLQLIEWLINTLSGIIQYPLSLVITPGEMGRFQCTAVATSVCSIQWRINRTFIIDSEADAYSIPARAGMGMISSTLHVLAAPQHNNSEVECCTYSETGESVCTSSVNLTITGAQKIPGWCTLVY